MTRHDERGVSLVEAAIVLSVVALLAGITAPAVGSYVDTARLARAREDAQVIGAAIRDFIADNAESQFLIDGSNGTASEPSTRADANRVNLLVSDGDIPALSAAIAAETFWTGAVNGGTIDTLVEPSDREHSGGGGGRSLSQSQRHHDRDVRAATTSTSRAPRRAASTHRMRGAARICAGRSIPIRGAIATR